MTLPGTKFRSSEHQPAAGANTNTGQAFVVGFTEKGSHTKPTAVRNMAEYVRHLGGRVTYGLLYDWLETYFADGGAVAYVGRIVGATPVAATANLFDAAGSVAPGDVSLVATAKSVGDWANSLRVAVLAPTVSGFRIQVTHATDTSLVETSPDLADRAAAVAWADAKSAHITLALGASAENPRVQAATALAGGTDDRATAADAQRAAALALFTQSYGPGQVVAPGITTTVAHQQLLDHAQTFERVAVLDVSDTGDYATLLAHGTALRGYGDRTDRFGKLVGPWAIIPGLLPNTTRDVPYSAVECGVIARNDGKGLAPNDNSAGVTNGQSRFAIGLKHGEDTAGLTFTPEQQEALNEAGVNLARIKFGKPTGYGLRTLADPEGDPWWINFGNMRERMYLAHAGGEIMERRMFQTIDGRGYLFSDLNGDLKDMMTEEWRRNALYGETAGDAFRVVTDSSVNTLATIQARQIRAKLVAKFSEAGEECILELVKVPLDQAVA